MALLLLNYIFRILLIQGGQNHGLVLILLILFNNKYNFLATTFASTTDLTMIIEDSYNEAFNGFNSGGYLYISPLTISVPSLYRIYRNT